MDPRLVGVGNKTPAQRTQRRACLLSSTYLTVGSTRSLLKDAPSLMSYWNSKAESPVRRAASIHLAKIRAIVRGLVEEAKLREPERFAQAWHMLMKGSIVSVGEGNRNAARDAKCAAQLILDGWQREGKVSKPTTKRRFHR